MSKNKVFIFFVVSFLFWVFVWNILFDFNLILIFFAWVLFFLILLLIIMKKYHFFVIIIAFWIFLWWIFSGINNYYIWQNLSKIKNYYNKEVFIKAEVLELYKKWETNNSYILKIISINENPNFHFNFLLYFPKNLILESGQIISLNSKIIKIENFTDNFSYEKFMLSRKVYFQVFASKLDLWEKKELWKTKKFIYDFRQKFLNIIFENFPKNEANLLAWILIWARENFPKELTENFNNSGLTHLVVVSGSNITIIIIFLWFLFKYFPVILRTILVFLFVIFFLAIVWENIAAIRAGIMWLLGYFILVSWRKGDSLSLLLLAAFLIVLYNPLYLNYDISFHLSFLAVVWLLYFQEFWDKVFNILPSFFAIKESFVLTMSALTTTLPIMIFNFWQVSILAPITNMLVWWTIPFAMFFGFFSILWQMINEKIWFILWFIDYFFLKYIIFIWNYFWSLEFAVYKIDLWMFWVYFKIFYFMILVFLILHFKLQKESPNSQV